MSMISKYLDSAQFVPSVKAWKAAFHLHFRVQLGVAVMASGSGSTFQNDLRRVRCVREKEKGNQNAKFKYSE